MGYQLYSFVPQFLKSVGNDSYFEYIENHVSSVHFDENNYRRMLVVSCLSTERDDRY